MQYILHSAFLVKGAGDLLDTTLFAKDGDIQCHSVVVLSQIRPYLDQHHGGSYNIILPDFVIADLEHMLNYCYFGR